MTNPSADVSTTPAPTGGAVEYAGPPPVLPVTSRPLLHSGASIARFVAAHTRGAMLLAVAGTMLYGWRAVGVLLTVVASAMLAAKLWRTVGSSGRQIRYDVTLWMSVLLALTLPAQLFATTLDINGRIMIPWPLLPAAGVLLVMMNWILGGIGAARIHPVIVTHLLLVICCQDILVPHYALKRQASFTGDLLDAPLRADPERQHDPWTARPSVDSFSAVNIPPASNQLETFTSGRATPERSWLSLDSLVRDGLPPLADFIVGGHPGPVGTSSAVAVIVAGLFLLYCGVIDFRIPLLIWSAAYVALLILPIPVVITDREVAWRWVLIHQPGIAIGLALTFVHYELMAGPLLFTAFFLATAPAVRPIGNRSRVLYALLIGVLAAALQLYISVSLGPYLALLAVSLLTPTMDKLGRARTLV